MAQSPEVTKMYEELEMLIEADETKKANAMLARIEAVETGEVVAVKKAEESEPKGSPAEVLIEETKKIAPDAVVTETAIDEPKEVTPVAEAQIKLDDIVTPEEKSEAVESATPKTKESATVSITKDQLGIAAFESVLDVLVADDIERLFTQVAETENLTALTLENTVVDAEHRIHIKSSGDVSRAARGAAIAVAGGVANGLVTSPSGSKHELRNGVCVSLQRQVQVNGDGTSTPLYAESACKGHLAYKKAQSGQFVQIEGKEHLRCKHGWAVMFANGYFVTFATNPHRERAVFEIANTVGDDEARIGAKQTEANWEASRQENFETRKTFAVAINAAVNSGNVTEAGRLPAATQIADYKLPSGETVAAAVSKLNGQRFALRIQVPVNGEMRENMTRVSNNMTELANIIAPAFQVCKMAAKDLVVLEVCPR